MSTPDTMAFNYRLNIKPHKDPPKKVVRRKKSVEEVPTAEESEPKSDESSDNFNYDDDVDDLLVSKLSSTCDDSEQIFAVKVYIAACRKYKCVPLVWFKKGLLKDTLTCRFLTLKQDELITICSALVFSHMVETLEFVQNNVCASGAVMFGDVIQNSSFLTHITLSENNIRSEGAKAICDAVIENNSIVYLDLSGNCITEKDGVYFQELIEKCDTLCELHLGNNKLMEDGVKAISEAVKVSLSLKVLDLSWNHIRMEGALAIGEALQQNASLEKLSLAWNGLYIEGAIAVGDALGENTNLVELDLTCNRLSEDCLADIIRGIGDNSTLRTLRIGRNTLSCNGASNVLKHIHSHKLSGITLLDLGKNQAVHDTFETILKELQKDRKIEVIYGTKWNTGSKSKTGVDENSDEYALLKCNPLAVLIECMRIQNYRLIDFFKELDTDNSNTICIVKLCDYMLKTGVPFSHEALLNLLQRLDADGDGMLNFAEMSEAQKMHKQQVRKALVSGVAYEDTDIGRATMLLREIIGLGSLSAVKSRRASSFR